MLLTNCHAKTSAARPICFACFTLAPCMATLTATHRPATHRSRREARDRAVPIV